MGTVYKVEHVRMAKLMALKLLHADLSRDEAMVARFKREARAISALKSRHVVQVFDVGEANGLFYILMEYLQGRDLGDLLVERRQLSPKRCLRIVQQICAGLADAHQQGIVHRDLKPENIFVCAPAPGEDELVKLLDFGLAKLHQRDESLAATQRGLILGTPHYMSPEQIEGEDVGPASDLYSLCAVIYKTITGSPPFPGDHALRVLNAHISQPIPRVSIVDAELAPLDEFFAIGLAKSPADRFQSTKELLSHLTTLVEGTQRPSAAYLDPIERKDIERSDTEWLLAPIDKRNQEQLATVEDFDRFEWTFRLKRLAVGLSFLLLLAGAAWAIVWGVALGHFFITNNESEPNNDLPEANPLTLNKAMLATLGEIPEGYRSDRDFFVLSEPPPEKMLRISVTPIPAIDLVIEVINRDGHLLFTQNALPKGYGELIPNFPSNGDNVYVLVRELWMQGTPPTPKPDAYYAILIEARDPLPGEEREPNDAIENASTMEERSIRGFLCNPGDVDIFMFSPSNRPAAFDVEVDGLANTDLRLRMLDGEHNELMLCDEGGLELAERCHLESSEQLRFPLYIELSAVRGFSTEHSYELRWKPALQTRTPEP
jgi:serine/threonine-protein kinase